MCDKSIQSLMFLHHLVLIPSVFRPRGGGEPGQHLPVCEALCRAQDGHRPGEGAQEYQRR